jgi:hypothetical protein
MAPPRAGSGIWKHPAPIEMDITFTNAD